MGASEGLVSAAESGDRAATLRALRDRLAREIEVCENARDLAPLSRQLTLILVELEALTPPEKKGTALDQLAERRRARGAETKGVDAAEGSTGSS